MASPAMARIQQAMLASQTPPVPRPTRIDPADMARRKALDDAGAAERKPSGPTCGASA